MNNLKKVVQDLALLEPSAKCILKNTHNLLVKLYNFKFFILVYPNGLVSIRKQKRYGILGDIYYHKYNKKNNVLYSIIEKHFPNYSIIIDNNN